MEDVSLAQLLLGNSSLAMTSPASMTSRCNDNVSHVNSAIVWRAVVYGVVCVVGLLGNALAIFVVLKRSNCSSNKKRQPSDIYLVNLCLADMCFLATLPFIAVTTLFRSWIFGEALCMLNIIFANVNRYSGTFTLVALSVDRYLAVCHPLSAARFRSTTFVTFVICITWLLAALPLVPALTYLTHEVTPLTLPSSSLSSSPEMVRCRTKCFIRWPDEIRGTAMIFYAIYQITVGFILPVSIICLAYTLLTARLRQSKTRLQQQAGSRSNQQCNNSNSSGHLSHSHRHHHRQIIRLVLVVISVFVLCWLPYCSMQLYLLIVRRHSALQARVLSISIILCYVNSMINPFLYIFTNVNFRANCVRMFCGDKCPKGRVHDYQFSRRAAYTLTAV